MYHITIIWQRVEKTGVFEPVPIDKHAAGVWEGAAPAIRENHSQHEHEKQQQNNQNPTLEVQITKHHMELLIIATL